MRENKVKNWNQFNENKKQEFLPLESLEWEFWNQSGTKLENSKLLNKSYDNEVEFQKHIDLYIDNIKDIAKNIGIQKDEVIKRLRSFWNESVSSEYVDMRVNRDRFLDFRNKVI